MASWRNIYLYVFGVMLFSAIGGCLLLLGQAVGGLVFVTGPILMAVALRMFGGDGWGTAGLRLRWRGNLRTYLIAILGFPVMIGLTLVIGQVAGATTLVQGFPKVYLAGVAMAVPATMLFALCEEFGWRGYLDPQLEALGTSDLQRHVLVAVIWGLWHLPYMVGTDEYADLPLHLFLPISMVSTLAMTVWYGIARKRSRSVWPAVIAHGMGNAMIWPLAYGALITVNNPVIFAPRPDAILMCGLLVLLAVSLWIMRRR